MATIRVYKSYNFTDKDPVIDKLRTIVEKEKLSYKKIHDDSNVSETTLRNWFHGQTRRPQHATVMAVLYASGYHQRLIKGPDPSLSNGKRRKR